MLTEAERSDLQSWLRVEIKQSSGIVLGQGYQATVFQFASPFGDVVVKSRHESLLLGLIGKLAIRREHQIYTRLADITGIPDKLGFIDDKHLVLESVSGPSLREYEPRLQDRDRFFALLLETLNAMHAAGVAHGDLKRKDNILVGPGEQPFIIDFGIACVDGGSVRGWKRKRYELFKQIDYNAWTKLKYGRLLQNLSPEDSARYKSLWLERIARWIRIPWQKLTLRRPRQRWRRR